MFAPWPPVTDAQSPGHCMKTSRRHELQTNELADSLARWIEAVKPYSRAALALLIAVVAALLFWGYLSAQGERKAAEGWNALFDAMNSRDPEEDLADLATRYAGTQVGLWARVTLADTQLLGGTNLLFMDRGRARDELRQAAETYQAILAETQDSMMRERATFGLARAHEAMGTPGDLENARKEYRSLAEQWPDSPYAAVAKARADDLDKAATKDFYDWVARYEPPRPVANEPGTPGARPDFLKDPLEGADQPVPSALDDAAPLPKFDDKPATGPTLSDEPTTAPPTGETPAPPSDEKPAVPPAEPPANTPAPPGDAPSAEPK
jgi:hypothetical protein